MTWRRALFLSLGLGVIIAVFLADPVAQDPRYHLFADRSALLSIPNFLNVVSNLPFLLVGVLGWRLVYYHPEISTGETRTAWMVFFFGIALTAFGSAYFHLEPNNATLFWDRLPMSIGFMSLISIITSEYISPIIGRRLLLPLLIVGMAAVVYWAYTESLGRGDLRAYAIVQFLPMLLIPIIIIINRKRSDLGPYLGWLIVFYVAAKLAEQLDYELYAAGNFMSGHTLKHLLASLAPASLLYGLMQRRERNTP